MNHEEDAALDVEELLEQVRKELVFANAAGPSDEREVAWVAYLEKLVELTSDWLTWATTAYVAADDRGPNVRYEMFSREGNDACEEFVKGLVSAGLAGEFQRKDLQELKEEGQKKIASDHGEVFDTEPDGRICAELNERLCQPQMWLEYGRWTG